MLRTKLRISVSSLSRVDCGNDPEGRLSNSADGMRSISRAQLDNTAIATDSVNKSRGILKLTFGIYQCNRAEVVLGHATLCDSYALIFNISRYFMNAQPGQEPINLHIPTVSSRQEQDR